MRHEIISLKDLKGLYLLRRRFKKWRQNEWKNHVVYVYGPFDRVWAEKHPLRFSWIKEYMFIYLQTDYEMHWILRIFYRIFWISIFNTCSYGELFTGVSPIVGISVYSKIYPNHALRASKTLVRAHDRVLTSRRHPPPPPFGDDNGGGGSYKLWRCLSILKRCIYQVREAGKEKRFSNPGLSKWMRRLPSPPPPPRYLY